MDAEFTKAIEGPVKGNFTCHLEGPVGSQTSQALIGRLRYLLRQGVAGYSILVLVPDRATRTRFRQQIGDLDLGPYGAVDLFTYSGLSIKLVQLFWPLVAGPAGFAAPQRPPVVLNYEAAQFLMGQIVAPLIDVGYFEGLALRPQRLLSQLLDSLNKAAVNGYPLAEVAPRLRRAWTGDENRLRYYDQVQTCIENFRAHCLERGLLDFSLVVEVFHRYLVEEPAFWRYFTERFRHLLADHLEETPPVAQNLVQRLLPECDSALLGSDSRGGFRVFLGVDGLGAAEVGGHCDHTYRAPGQGLASAAVAAFADSLGHRLGQEGPAPSEGAQEAVAGLIQTRYRAQMIEAVADEVLRLVRRGVAPGEVAVVAPYVDGVLRFMLGEAFEAAEIPFAVVRRFESLREEPVVRACLTLAGLAHPQWQLRLSAYDVGEALRLALAPIDPVRAALAARLLYDPAAASLRPKGEVAANTGERLGFVALERYGRLWDWLANYRNTEPVPIDHFLRRLFGEVLSHPDLPPDEAGIYSKLIASAANFRQIAPAVGLDGASVGRRYVEMVFEGVVAAQYLPDLDIEAAPESIALVAPIYTYLLSNHVVRYQFWLDIGAISWWEPPHQPLTNHHVLGKRWPQGAPWDASADFSARNQTLYRLVRGLCQRCRQGIYLCSSELEATGHIQDSPLLRAVQQVLQEKP